MSIVATSACVGGRYVGRDAQTVPQAPTPPQPMQPRKHPADAWGLSPRERQVLESYMVHGVSHIVAKKLFISEKTVEAHLGNARNKAGIERTILLVLAYDRALRAGGFEL